MYMYVHLNEYVLVEAFCRMAWMAVLGAKAFSFHAFQMQRHVIRSLLQGLHVPVNVHVHVYVPSGF